MRIISSTCDYLVTPQQTLSSAWQAGQGDGRLALPGIAVLTFSKAVVDRLGELCGLEDVPWISPPHHPYAAARTVKQGVSQGLGVVVLVPPMGASPLACIVEDLVACGVEAVFLVCAAWSLGPPVQLGDLIVPDLTTGPDGTSIHYGNISGCFSADPLVVEALSAAGRELGARVHVGGNGSCEALYRITPRALEGFRQQGCLCMDNGEASTLFAVTWALGVVGGVIFQPYIELERGWDPSWLRDERYGAASRIQAEAVLEAAAHLRRRGLLSQLEIYGSEP
jgi:uridine phosphorylase